MSYHDLLEDWERDKGMFSSKELHACSQKKKSDLYGWVGISAIEEVWLTHNADTQWTLEGREEASGQRKSFLFKFFLFCLKM